jgi:proline dehydrogenase
MQVTRGMTGLASRRAAVTGIGLERLPSEPMRRVLLWMARNRWLRDRVPRLWFARRAVRRFMPGEQLDDALDAAERYREQGIGALFTHLGENLADLSEADAVAAHYLDALDRITGRGIDAEISVKLTQLGIDLDPAVARRHMAALATRARELGAGVVWIDMEGSDYTEATVALYEELLPEHPNLGLCLQAYLRRTAADVQRLLPLSPHIRMVKGAYDEPTRIAYRSRPQVDASFVEQCVVFLTEGRGTAGRLGLGTHDVRLIEQIAAAAEAAGIGRDAYEVEMLYGIRTDEQQRLAAAGFPTRTLIAYGEFWYPWYVRRLAERPANVAFVLRQLLPW